MSFKESKQAQPQAPHYMQWRQHSFQETKQGKKEQKQTGKVNHKTK